MEAQTFTHKVSRGSRYNQIYIPKNMADFFDVGDIVEIKLIEKKESLHYSKNLRELGKLGEFKEGIIKQIFSILSRLKEIQQVFVVGSFLTEKEDYRDLDLILIGDKEEAEERAYSALISMNTEKFNDILEFDPLIRSMLYYFVSSEKFDMSEKIEINKDHINFLLMMPEDLLKIRVSGSRIYFDNLRRLICVARFIKKQDVNPLEINSSIKKLVGKDLFDKLRNNEGIEEKDFKIIKNIIKNKLGAIRNLIT